MTRISKDTDDVQALPSTVHIDLCAVRNECRPGSQLSGTMVRTKIPSNAINELEMFQPETFDPALNDKELGMAEGIGMNTVRVFLQDQLWQQDPKAFTKRLDTFLDIAARHHIKPLLVLFDSCWETNPHLGPQHPPIPGIHNSGWVQSPGKERLQNRSVQPQLEAYVKGVEISKPIFQQR
jgi:hypothetical protein